MSISIRVTALSEPTLEHSFGLISLSIIDSDSIAEPPVFTFFFDQNVKVENYIMIGRDRLAKQLEKSAEYAKTIAPSDLDRARMRN